MIFNSDVDIEHIFNNPGSSGYIPPNSLIFDPHDKNPYVICHAPVLEKPANGFMFEITNQNGALVVDISIISDEALYKVSEIKEMFNMITSIKMYVKTHAYITEKTYLEIIDNSGLYKVTLKENFTKEFTNKLINSLLGIKESPSDMVDSLLDDIFGSSLKKPKNEYIPDNEKISAEQINEFETTDSIDNLINPFLESDMYEVEEDNFNLNAIMLSKSIKDIYNIINLTDCSEILSNQLLINNSLNIFMNYDGTTEPLPSNINNMIENFINEFINDKIIQSKISEFFNLVGYDLRINMELVKNTNTLSTNILSDNTKTFEECVGTKEFLFNELRDFYEQYNCFIKKVNFNNHKVEEKYKINLFCIIIYLINLINKNYNKFRTELIGKEKYIDEIKTKFKETVQMYDITYVQKYHPEMILEKYNLSTLENENEIVVVGNKFIELSTNLFNKVLIQNIK